MSDPKRKQDQGGRQQGDQPGRPPTQPNQQPGRKQNPPEQLPGFNEDPERGGRRDIEREVER
jgi:hypothetical protein